MHPVGSMSTWATLQRAKPHTISSMHFRPAKHCLCYSTDMVGYADCQHPCHAASGLQASRMAAITADDSPSSACLQQPLPRPHTTCGQWHGLPPAPDGL